MRKHQGLIKITTSKFVDRPMDTGLKEGPVIS